MLCFIILLDENFDGKILLHLFHFDEFDRSCIASSVYLKYWSSRKYRKCWDEFEISSITCFISSELSPDSMFVL